MKREDLIKALEEIEKEYTLVSLVDSYDNDKTLGGIYLNKKHSIDDFQKAIYKAKLKRAEEINAYGDDWSFISEELDDFDYFEIDNDFGSENWVEY